MLPLPAPPSLPLVLKLAAAGIAGTASLLSFRRLRRRLLLSSLRLDLLSSLSALGPAAPPPSLLVIGFRSHGKSALVNTLARVLADERGLLVLRSVTAPPGPTPATLEREIIRADVAEEGEEEERAGAVQIVDARGMIEAKSPAEEVRADVEREIEGSGGVAVDCVLAVVRCGVPPKERRESVKRLADVASVVRGKGLSLVVVLTQRKALRSAKQAEELKKKVAYKARTDCVYFIENYTVDFCRPTVLKNGFDTRLTVLAIVRQCVEFARLYRSRSSRKANAVSPPAIGMPLVKEQ